MCEKTTKIIAFDEVAKYIQTFTKIKDVVMLGSRDVVELLKVRGTSSKKYD